MIPWIFGPEHVTTMHYKISLFGAIFFIGVGVILLALWALSHKKIPEEAREDVGEAFLFIGAGIAWLVLGVYLLILFGFFMACFTIYLIIKWLEIVRGQDSED